jgi:carboxypeptidase Taq
MIAAQLMQAARTALPDLDIQVTRGDLKSLTGWLRTHWHQHASLYSTPELIEKATGKQLDPAIYRAHLKARYLA